MDMIWLFIRGIAIGMVNIIPGVSGGTLAVIFGIYDKFVNAITFNVKKLWQNKRFVVPLLCGMALGVLIFSKLIEVLYTKFPVQTNYFFTGLIIGSLPMLYSLMTKNYKAQELLPEAQTESSEKPAQKLSAGIIASIVIFTLVGIAVVVVFTILQGKFDVSSMESALPEVSAALLIRIFVAGVLGAVAMIIPGISGSLLMLMMGVYTIIVTSIPALFSPETSLHALILLLPNGAGVLIGLICGARLIGYLLKRFSNATYGCIFGLIVGSIYAVFPGFTCIQSVTVGIASVVALIFGTAMAFFSSKIDNMNK